MPRQFLTPKEMIILRLYKIKIVQLFRKDEISGKQYNQLNRMLEEAAHNPEALDSIGEEIEKCRPPPVYVA